MESPLFYGLVAFIFLLSGLKQGLTGFGLGIVSMSLLPLIMSVPDAMATVTLIGALSILGSLGAYWKDVSWREALPLVISMVVGIPFGIFMLSAISPEAITRILGAVLLLTCATQVFLPKHQKLYLPKFLGPPMGFLGGMLAGALNMGGPPVLIFLQSRPLSAKVLVATLQLIFAVSGLSRSGLIVAWGLVTPNILLLVAIGILPAWIGIMVSARFQKSISQEALRRIVLIALILLGLKYLIF
jgi:uncharacterized protein